MCFFSGETEQCQQEGHVARAKEMEPWSSLLRWALSLEGEYQRGGYSLRTFYLK